MAVTAAKLPTPTPMPESEDLAAVMIDLEPKVDGRTVPVPQTGAPRNGMSTLL